MSRQLLVFLSVLLFLAHGWGRSSTVGAISGAMGGAGRSSVDVGESYLLNPAGVAHLRGAAIAFGTTRFESPAQQSTQGPNIYDGWRLSLNENSPDSMWGSSIFLSQVQNQSPSKGVDDANQFNDAWFTLGNFLYQKISVGLSYHFHESLTDLRAFQEHNFGLGVLWTPLDNLGIGFSLQNFRAPPKEIPTALTQGSSGGIGVLYLHEDYLRLRLDYSRKNHRLASRAGNEWSLGLENAMTPWLLVRIGAAQENRDDRTLSQKWSFGLGFAGPRFGIHYGLQSYQVAELGTEHSVDFMIPF